jgi:hypothetical protein
METSVKIASLNLPNDETQQALAEVLARDNLESYDDAESLLEDLDV